ncbi:MAG TPA: low molecular weight phosphotyrosine protein phosphatase [Bacteroidales bacterium]|jgi:protein-tyrosine phosphatase|nr:low molecular weight phosphotyrosine protein phosphatase [Bacteroidales bacterium]
MRHPNIHPNKTEGKKVRILFVCLGNICRSPAAEGIMKQLVEENELEDFIEVESAGTSGWHEGDLPDERMRAHGAKRDYDFNSRARQFRKSDLDRFDYIIVMDSSNYTNVKSLASTKEQLDKIHMMTDFSQRYSHDQVPDPYYGGASGFELVLDLLEDAVEGLLQAITEKHAFA